MHQHKKIRTKKAFSLLEVLLSVFVMSVGLMTIVAVMSGSLRHSYDSRDIIIASGLAQEGVELVRNVRDNNFDPIVSGGNGFAHIPDKSHCRIDWSQNIGQDIDCEGSGKRPEKKPDRYYLQYMGAGVYEHSNTTRERFSRYIYIKKNGTGADETAEVRSFVYWGTTPSFGNEGSNRDCTLENECVFTESFLTSWK